MILDKHILQLDANAWLLVIVDAATDKVIRAYAFDTENDAETAAKIAIGFYNAPAPFEQTYDQFIHNLCQTISQLYQEETGTH